MVIYYFTNGVALPPREVIAWAKEEKPGTWKTEWQQGRMYHTIYRWWYNTREEAVKRVIPWECENNGPWWAVEIK
jgi:hypothetical protein